MDTGGPPPQSWTKMGGRGELRREQNSRFDAHNALATGMPRHETGADSKPQGEEVKWQILL
jgi:hypothetical protein